MSVVMSFFGVVVGIEASITLIMKGLMLLFLRKYHMKSYVTTILFHVGRDVLIIKGCRDAALVITLPCSPSRDVPSLDVSWSGPSHALDPVDLHLATVGTDRPRPGEP